jgi:hypothetical protein
MKDLVESRSDGSVSSSFVEGYLGLWTKADSVTEFASLEFDDSSKTGQ